MTLKRALITLVLSLGIVSLAMSALFISPDVTKTSTSAEAVQLKNSTSDGDLGVAGYVGMPDEAADMVTTLREHQRKMGFYTELEKTNPEQGN